MNTRALAATVLVRVVVEGKSLTDALEEAVPDSLQDNDRAFVQAMCYGVIRWYHKLDFILNQLVAKPIRDEHVRLLVLLGLYQLEYTRVKPHAAVSETVSALGNKIWAKALINGVLRNFQRQRERLMALAEIDESALWSHPAWLLGKIRKNWPQQCEEVFRQANLPPPMTLRVNLSRTTRLDYLEKMASAGLSAQPCQFAASGVLLENPIPIQSLPGFSQGLVSVQDEAAQLAAGLLALKSGLRVLDVCAAPGGKTLHMLESHDGLGEVVALDIAADRLKRIEENLLRAGLAATVLCGDAEEPASWWDGKLFDRILVDAPCSATGVIRRHPDIKLLRKPRDITKLVATQRRILECVWPLLGKGGLMVYATCSVLKEENEVQIAAFLHSHSDAREVPIPSDWGSARPHGRQILSGEDGMD
ncbi:MAG: 16S rRNA (cytosine(967)-C(5))-methyltransferase RsmB, partial [Candidatus Methylumidiphilus sp.]